VLKSSENEQSEYNITKGSARQLILRIELQAFCGNYFFYFDVKRLGFLVHFELLEFKHGIYLFWFGPKNMKTARQKIDGIGKSE